MRAGVAIASAATQRLPLTQESRVGGASAVDGRAALEHYLAHPCLSAGAQQLSHAHDVGVKGAFAAPDRLYKRQVADGVHPFGLEQLHQQRIAHVGQDEVETIPLPGRLLRIQANDVGIPVGRQAAGYPRTPVASHTRDQHDRLPPISIAHSPVFLSQEPGGLRRCPWRSTPGRTGR